MAAGFGTTVKFSATAENNVSGPMDKASGSLKGAGQAAAGAGTSLSSLGSLGQVLPGIMGPAAASMGALSAALGPIAIGIGLIVGAIGGFNMIVDEANRVMSISIDTFGLFEKKLAEVQTILGVTRKAMEGVTDAALGFGATYGKSAAEELEAFYATASAGFADAAQASMVMDTANKLAVAGVTDMNSSVDLLTTVLNGFGIAAEGAGGVSDALFTAVRAGKTTVGELAAAFGNVVPSASAAGATLEDTLSAMAALTLAGQSTAEASTALARAFDVLIKQPPQVLAEFKKFGIEAEDLNVKERGLLPVIESISQGFKGNEDALAQAIPQIRAFKAIMPLAGKQMEAFVGTLDAMDDKLGATDQAFNTIANTLSFQRDRWNSMMEGIKTRLGQVFAPAIKTALDILNDLLGVIEKLPAPIKNTIFAMAGIGFALPSVLGKLGSLIWTLTKLAAVALVVGNLVIVFQGALAGMIPALGGIIGRVIKFAVAWRKNLDNIQDRVKRWATNIKLILRGLGEAIANEGMISGPLAKELEEAGVVSWVAKLFVAFDRLKLFMESFWEGFSTAVIAGAESIGEAFPEIQALIDLIKAGGEDAEGFAKALDPEGIKKFATETGKALGEIVRFLADGGRAWKENQETIEAVVEALKLMGEVIKALLPVAQALWKVIGPILQFGADMLGPLLGGGPPPQVKPAGTEGGVPIEEEPASAGEITGSILNAAIPSLLQTGVTAVSPGAGLALQGLGVGKQAIEIHTTLEVDKEKLASKVQQVEVETGEEQFEAAG